MEIRVRYGGINGNGKNTVKNNRKQKGSGGDCNGGTKEKKGLLRI